jgi:hypothetical protein
MLLRTALLLSGALLLSNSGLPGIALAGATTSSVFDASPAWPAPYIPRLRPAPDQAAPLRRLTVEERVGEARTDELVRVPVFLHEDEPADPDDWALYSDADTARRSPIPHQADDIRRDASGRITRFHLYFPLTLAAWERRSFVLVRGRTPASSIPAAASVTGDRVTLAGDDLSVTFLARGPRTGAIAAIAPRTGAVALPEGWIAPALTLVRQAGDCTTLRRTPLSYETPDSLEVREVLWGSGPLFSKFMVRTGPPGVPDSAQYTYRIPRRGTVLVQTERLAPEGEPTAEVVGAADHRLLSGRLVLGDSAAGMHVLRVPAGLRLLTRSTNGHFLDALVNHEAGLTLLPVPYVQTGAGQIEIGRGASVEFAGPSSFHRAPEGNSATLRAFWGEVRFVFTSAVDEEPLWHEARRNLQPLVAIVDEPTLGPADCRAPMPQIAQRFLEIKYWGRAWAQDAALLWLRRERIKFDALFANHPGAAECEPAFHLPGWARTTPPGPRNPKDQGRIDPYHVSYGSSTLPLYAALVPGDRLPAASRAIGQASKQAFGRVNAAGFPHVDCFVSAFNMQIGPLGLALYGGRRASDPALAAWALDALHAPGVTGIYGHGQRPYAGEIGRPEASDFLYESISDFHLRSMELSSGEDLWLHPAALSRYFDCVDVTADLQHHPVPEAGDYRWDRANFFRGQAHDHRWENWSCAPFAGMFARASDRGEIGSTEAAYWLDAQSRRKQTWNELLWFAHADLLLETALAGYSPATAPALPQRLRVDHEHGANHLRWAAVPGVAGYRIYRATTIGGPWTWINSPYTEPAGKLVTGTDYADEAGRANDAYLVTAVDAAGRESRWYADEPGPR